MVEIEELIALKRHFLSVVIHAVENQLFENMFFLKLSCFHKGSEAADLFGLFQFYGR